jgi:hypothetical protein
MGSLYMFARRLLKKMAAKIEKLNQHFFLDLVQELSDSNVSFMKMVLTQSFTVFMKYFETICFFIE